MAKEAEIRARQPKPVVPRPAPKKDASVTNPIEQRVNALNRHKSKAEEVRSQMTVDQMRNAIASLSLVQAQRVLNNILDTSPVVRNAVGLELSSVKEKDATSNEPRVDPSSWTGLYNVEIPSKTDEIEYIDCDASDLTFEIYPSSTSSHLWAAFNFGMLSGFMRSINPVPKSLNTEVYFEYRGREEGENVMTFDDKKNRAIITFLPGGLFQGEIDTDCFGDFKIYGALRNEDDGKGKPSVQRKTAQQKAAVKKWKAEYRRINGHNYEVENGSRWNGGWGGEYKDDEAFESDTTAGKKKHRLVDLTNFIQKSNDESEERYDAFEDEEGVYGFLGYAKPL